MHRGLSRIAVVIVLGLAAFNAATMSLSPAQGPTGIPDSEREYRQATWTLLNSIKNRQVRQDRILGFGFGATVAPAHRPGNRDPKASRISRRGQP
jgi:hypothetical protein